MTVGVHVTQVVDADIPPECSAREGVGLAAENSMLFEEENLLTHARESSGGGHSAHAGPDDNYVEVPRFTSCDH